jgi:hypothetical protein
MHHLADCCRQYSFRHMVVGLGRVMAGCGFSETAGSEYHVFLVAY